MAGFTVEGKTADQIKAGVAAGDYTWDEVLSGFYEWYSQVLGPEVAWAKAKSITEGILGPKTVEAEGKPGGLASPMPELSEEEKAKLAEQQVSVDEDIPGLGGTGTSDAEKLEALKDIYVANGYSPEEAESLASNDFNVFAAKSTPLAKVKGTAEAVPIPGGPKETGEWGEGGVFLNEMPQAAWQRAMGMEGIPANPYQEWWASQATPAYAGWGARSALGKVLGNPTGLPELMDYFKSGGAQRGQTQALGALQSLRGMTEEQQKNWMDDLAAQGVSLKSVLETGLRGQGIAPAVAGSMASRWPKYQSGWGAETMGGAVPGKATMLSYVLSKLGF